MIMITSKFKLVLFSSILVASLLYVKHIKDSYVPPVVSTVPHYTESAEELPWNYVGEFKQGQRRGSK